MSEENTTALVISLDRQTLCVTENGNSVASYPVSTSIKGMGCQPGSFRTPTGRFRVAEAIGADEPMRTRFESRIPTGTWDGSDLREDLILTRILWLDGLESHNRNTKSRYIYIHGTNHESSVGQPTSHGCIRMRSDDILNVFDRSPVGTEVVIEPATTPRGKLCFIDCDSTLSSIEGIDELARARGSEVLERVEALTNAAMNGEIPISEVFPRRMEMIRPDRDLCERIARQYIETMVKGVDELITELKASGWTPVILSGGFAPLILPLAQELGIDHVEAVPIHFHEDGSYAGYGESYPTTRNHGKNEIIREWKAALLPERTIMIGDGASDLETKPDVDRFVGFGGVVSRPKVRQGADFWMVDMRDRTILWQAILGKDS